MLNKRGLRRLARRKKLRKNESNFLGGLFGFFILFAFLFPGDASDKEATISDTASSEVATTAISTAPALDESTVVESNVPVTEGAVSEVPAVEPVYEEEAIAVVSELDVPDYTGADSIVLNGGLSTFTADELANASSGWAEYGDLDEYNRVTTMNALVTPDMYDTGTDADSSVLPTGWSKSNQNSSNPNQLNRGHLLADVLGGSGEDWRNLVTLYRNANYPTMYFEAEDIVREAIQNGSTVRYRVTPLFVGDELMCKGLHIMAKSITDDSVDLNVFVYNEPKDGLE
jgi:DNA-entry nuclease